MKREVFESLADPIQSHLAHLGHLSRSSSSANILRRRFGMAGAEANRRSKIISAHIKQALDFFASAQVSSPSVAPVPLYYSFLNLAVAVWETYRTNSQKHRQSHGLYDRTFGKNRIGLRTKLVEVGGGAVTDFHSLLSGATLASKELSLLDMTAAIPTLSAELYDAFGIAPRYLDIKESLYHENISGADRYTPQAKITYYRRHGNQLRETSLSKRVLDEASPLSSTGYRYHSGSGSSRVYRWPNHFQGQGAMSRAKRMQEGHWVKISNFGANDHMQDGGSSIWTYLPGGVTMPALTAILIMGFAAASIARYRPGYLSGLQESRYYLLFDIYRVEAPGIFLPAIRNLLFKENTHVKSTYCI